MSEASNLLAACALSSTELVEAVLERIAQTEPQVHAYATVLPERALASARRMDTELAHGYRRSAMHGIPVGVKDICFTKDVPTEAGSRVMAGHIPSYDATVVRRLEDAGAIIVGKTVTHEFAWGVNRPPTRSPWQLDSYPGGSSAGSGVAVSVRSALGAIGTDTGGSIRIPAVLNGIVGLKPTFGRISRYGVVAMSATLDHVGLLTRTVEDCALLLQVTAGHDPLDEASIDAPVPDYRALLNEGLEGTTIGIERDYGFYQGIADDVRAAVDAVIDEYQELGARIVEVKIPEFKFAGPVCMTIMLSETSAEHQERLRAHRDKYEQSTRLMLEAGEFVPATHYIRAQRARRAIRDRVKTTFELYNLDALLWPTVPTTTAPLDALGEPTATGQSPMGSYVHHTFSANVVGLPALSVPCGFASNGLPVGFQLLGRPFDESSLFRLARNYERGHEWTNVRPPVLMGGQSTGLRA